MIGINSILPFLEHARVLRTYSGSVKNQDLYVTKALWSRLGVVSSVPEPYKASLLKKIPTVFYVKPIGVIIMKGTDYDICVYKSCFQEIFCNIVEVDYTNVAQTIVLDYKGEKIYARYPYLNGYLEENIYTTDLIDYSISGDVLYKPILGYGSSSLLVNKTDKENYSETVTFSEPLLEWEDNTDKMPFINEEVKLEDFAKVSIVDALEVTNSKSPQVIRLESYFTGGYVTNRTPLLVGPSAVAKSATVKSLTNKYGMRLVDVRLAFTSRLDIEGLTGRYEKNGVIMSEASPASFMLECSDPYIDFCRDALNVLSKAQNEESDENKKKIYQESIDKFREGAKIPVLFLDEVTRAPASVRQAFTKILSDKEFMGYPMTYARVIAATNVALGAPEELQDIYQTQDVGDAAFYDRFESMPIYPEDVLSDWKSWAKSKNDKGRFNIHPVIMSLLDSRSDLSYDFGFLYNVYSETLNEDDVTSSPYPNYRTWELVSNYLYAQESKKQYMVRVIEGLVGSNASNELVSLLNREGWKEKPDSVDVLTDVINQGMDTGVPVMMVTPSSCGKTSRIKSIAKERDALLIDINLAEQDRVDLLGPPVRVPVEKFVSSSINKLPDNIQNILTESLKTHNLPSHVTIKAPKEEIITKLSDASKSGREVIIHFDELNRVQNPSVMSSVFECISDHRVLGVNFNPENVRVFASCNMGENYSDAQPLDPAFSARFVMYKRLSYDKSDVEAFINYMKKKKFSKSIIGFFNSKSTEDCIKIISSVENRSLELSSASTRAWEDLDKFLKDDANKNICKGTVFFESPSDLRVYQDFVKSPSVSGFREVTSVVDSKLKNWSGLNSDIKIPIGTSNGREFITAKELVNMYNEAKLKVESSLNNDKGLKDILKIFSNILLYMYSANREISSVRRKIFKMALGNFADMFNTYYNEVSGISEEGLEISDCVTVEIFHRYVNQEIRGISLPNEISKRLLAVTKDFVKEFPLVDKDRARDVINYSVNCLTTSESIAEYLRGIVRDKNVENLIISAESGDVQFSVILLKRAGININPEKIKNAEKIIRQPRMK